MAFTVQDYHDFVRLLAEHPEWRPELRRLVLSDELLTLPELVLDLTAAQARAEQRGDRLEAAVERLTEAQERTEQRLAELAAAQARTEQGVGRLAEAQERTEQRLEQLAEAQQRTEQQLVQLILSVNLLSEQVREMVKEQKRMGVTLGDHKGLLLEFRYRDHAPGFFGQWLKRAQPVALVTLEETLEAALSYQELRDVLRLDLLITGRLRDQPEAPQVWLAVEVAGVLDEADVARAARRAALLRRAGYRALPLVAGGSLSPPGEDSAQVQKVAVMLDGQGSLWDEMLAAWDAG